MRLMVNSLTACLLLTAVASDARPLESPIMSKPVTLPVLQSDPLTFLGQRVRVCAAVTTVSNGERVLSKSMAGDLIAVKVEQVLVPEEAAISCVTGVWRRTDGVTKANVIAKRLPMSTITHGVNPDYILAAK